jgi:hypothetical protein
MAAISARKNPDNAGFSGLSEIDLVDWHLWGLKPSYYYWKSLALALFKYRKHLRTWWHSRFMECTFAV